jgi:asparagine synthase (glutamine-hydrolysing)
LTSFGVLYAAGDASCSATLVGPVVEALGPYRIVGNVRLDARDDLRARLAVRDRDLSDRGLCLHAYAKWGERFVDVIAGDFGFALWDDSRRCLLAARDRLGIRPLFHASVGGTAFVSDSLDWIMSHAEVPRDLDETWIGDFLAVGWGLDFESTVRRHVRRVPPAHVLKVSPDGEDLRRYWQLEIGDPVHFTDRRVYAERFLDLVGSAVKDRLPPDTQKLGISMSGGLDSTTLAACAVAAIGDPSRIVAECHHYERSMADDEDRYSSLVAAKLGIKLRVRAVDNLNYDPLWRLRGVRTSEPTPDIVQMHWGRMLAHEFAQEANVWFYGEGPDNALAFDRDAYLAWLRSRGDWRTLGKTLVDYVRVKGLADWRETVARRLTPRPANVPAVPDFPRWITPDFERRISLRERVRDLLHIERAHPWHPSAVGSLRHPIWPALFDHLRLAEPSGPFEWRHPYLDLRVLEYMISLPPIPWAWRKHLLREAMRDRLPREVLSRKKTPLAAEPLHLSLSQHGFPPLSGGARFARYVVPDLLPSREALPARLDSAIAAHALDYWLMQE